VRVAAAATHGLSVPVITVVVSLTAVRNVGVETWGAFVGAMILVQLSAQLADFGSRDALLPAFSRRPAGVARTWRGAVASRIPLLAIGPLVFLAAGNDPWRVLVLTAWLVALFLCRLHDGLVTYHRAFGFAVAMEIVAAIATLGVVVAVGAGLGVDLLLGTFAAVAWLRAVALGTRFGLLRAGPGWNASAGELRRSWPFFGLTFSGAIQSRVDLYVVAALSSAAQLGTYQVLTAIVLLVQSLAGALLAPVVPALHRLPRAGVLRGARRMAVVGCALATAGTVGLWLLMTSLFRLPVDAPTLAAAWLAMAPAYAYVALVQLAFREGDERAVLWVTLAGVAVAGLGAALTVPVMGLTGAILSAAVAQVGILAFHALRARSRGDRSVSPLRPAEA
jgi:O-antigen/teichoic acid export membrane protein